MNQLACGDMEALGALYLRHGDAVQRFVGSVLAGQRTVDVRDVCHDVFLALTQLAPRYEDRGKLRAYLLKLAASRVRSLRRRDWLRHGLLKVFFAEQRDNRLESSSDECDLSKEARCARAAFDLLAPKQREILALAVGEGLCGEEIALALGISHAAVRVRLHRAREALKREMNALSGSTSEGD